MTTFVVDKYAMFVVIVTFVIKFFQEYCYVCRQSHNCNVCRCCKVCRHYTRVKQLSAKMSNKVLDPNLLAHGCSIHLPLYIHSFTYFSVHIFLCEDTFTWFNKSLKLEAWSKFHYSFCKTPLGEIYLKFGMKMNARQNFVVIIPTRFSNYF